MAIHIHLMLEKKTDYSSFGCRRTWLAGISVRLWRRSSTVDKWPSKAAFSRANHNYQQEFPFDAGEEVRQRMCLAAFSRALLTWWAGISLRSWRRRSTMAMGGYLQVLVSIWGRYLPPVMKLEMSLLIPANKNPKNWNCYGIMSSFVNSADVATAAEIWNKNKRLKVLNESNLLTWV